MTPHDAGCLYALQKLGFDMRDVRQLLKAVKNRIVRARRADSPSILGAFGHRNNPFAPRPPAAFPGKTTEHLIEQGALSPDARGITGKMVMPRKGDLVTEHRRAQQVYGEPLTETAHLTGQDRQAISAISKGHELDELILGQRSPALRYMREHGHASPAVLLREHNKVTTLPKELAAAGDYARTFRRGSQDVAELSKAIPGFAFGESPRLSRHAIRRLSEKLTQGS